MDSGIHSSNLPQRYNEYKSTLKNSMHVICEGGTTYSVQDMYV